MIILAGFLIGAGLGWHNAGKRGGNRLDRAQYAAVGAILGAILGVVASIVIGRLL